MKPILFIITFFLLSFHQKQGQQEIFKIINANEQRWSGGIAGRWGVRNYFSLSTIVKFSELKIDTFWIGTKCFPVKMKPDTVEALDQNKCNSRYTISCDGVLYEFFSSESHHNDRLGRPLDKVKAKRNHPIFLFNTRAGQ